MNSNARGTRSRSPDGEAPAAPRTIDLYSRGSDGSPVLWKRAVQVVPITAFEQHGNWIKSGHYVINHNGDAIVVHCGNVRDHSVSVQFMDKELTPCVLPRKVIELMLLGKVVVTEEQRAAVFERRRLSDFFDNTAAPPPAIARKRTTTRKPKSE